MLIMTKPERRNYINNLKQIANITERGKDI